MRNVIPLLIVAGAAAWATQPVYAQYGDVSGQVILEGSVPEPKVLIAKGDQAAKDAAVCSKDTVLSQELVVNPDNNGVANVFVYLPKAKDIKPELKNSKEKEIVFDQKGCTFVPHTLFVRTDQTVIVKSDDAIAHNTHTYPLRNQATNVLVSPNDRAGVKVQFRVPEKLPTQVKCDIHPWMSAYWLVLDHPYAAVTDADGNFTIKGLPAGEHELIIWQEKVGYVDRKFKVTVRADTTTEVGPIEIPAAKVK